MILSIMLNTFKHINNIVYLEYRSGSLIIDAEVIIPEDTGSSNSILNATSLLIFNDETIEVDGQVGTFQKIEIINGKYILALSWQNMSLKIQTSEITTNSHRDKLESYNFTCSKIRQNTFHN